MSSGSYRLNFPEQTELACEEWMQDLLRIIQLAEEPEVDQLAEQIRHRISIVHAQAGPAGRRLRRIRREMDGDDIWPPEPASGALQQKAA